LSITSNCCPPKNQWQKFITDLKEITDVNAIDHFMLYCSLDTWGEQAEYIRTGMDFDVLHKNVIQYLTESERHSLTFIVTCNLLCLPSFPKLFENILKLRQTYNTDRQLVWFDTPMLHDPKWMSMKLASKEMLQPLLNIIEFMQENKETTLNRYKGFKDYEIDKLQRLYDWAAEPMQPEEEILHKKNFIAHFRQHDERRNTNLKTMFPELLPFIEECEALIDE
jgi:hypothetical protein